MRWPALILLVLFAALQYPLWLGKGSWLRVWDVDRLLRAQQETNQQLEQRNAGLEAEVVDLKTGLEAIEERARFELGLTGHDEIFVQVPRRSPDSGASGAAARSVPDPDSDAALPAPSPPQ